MEESPESLRSSNQPCKTTLDAQYPDNPCNQPTEPQPIPYYYGMQSAMMTSQQQRPQDYNLHVGPYMAQRGQPAGTQSINSDDCRT